MTVFPGVLPNLKHQFISGLSLLLRFVSRVASARDLTIVCWLSGYGVSMSPYYFAPGRLFGVEHFQVLGASMRTLCFWLRAHFVAVPFQLRVFLLEHGSKSFHRDRIADW